MKAGTRETITMFYRIGGLIRWKILGRWDRSEVHGEGTARTRKDAETEAKRKREELNGTNETNNPRD
jgi:hypothetical protein